MAATAPKPRLLIICPGRGSYAKPELGSLRRYAAGSDYLKQADDLRRQWQLPTITELDGRAHFSPAEHLAGTHAAALIFTAAMCDLEALPRDRYDIAAVLGNSMGFYIALAASGALSFAEALYLVQTMGGHPITGGQIIYPVVDEEWRRSPSAAAAVDAALQHVNARGDAHAVMHSIRLGGFAVLAGTDAGVRELLKRLPPVKLGERDYPFQLAGHSAFHTALLREASENGLARCVDLEWQAPRLPLIDGRGAIWRPAAADPQDLFAYTLTRQVTETFDFTAAVRVGLREFGPDKIVLLGPGETLGGAIAHVIIQERWQGMDSRTEFMNRQQRDPFLLNMGRPAHYDALTAS